VTGGGPAAGRQPWPGGTFDPDWTVAPAETLKEALEERGITGWDLRHDPLAREVLDRLPLREEHALALEGLTGIPARMWLACERAYREDLAAGRTDFDAAAREDGPGGG
jgi:hypothetical protein